jgi:hypothetical protein
LRPRVYRPRIRAVRRPAPSRSAIAQASQREAQRQAAQDQAGQPEAFWPSAPQNIFDYVLSSQESGLWEHSHGAIVASMFARASKVADEREEADLVSVKIEQTTGTASINGDEPVCGEYTASRVEAETKQLHDTLALADDQKIVLAELRFALLNADEEITADCPRGIPATLPDRLRVMQDRLWAIRVTATGLRAPLQAFYNALTNEQRAKLDANPPSGRERKKGAPANEAAELCHVLAQRSPQWPADQIARAVRPNKDQQASLEALSQTSSQMNLMMMGSCPKKTPVTPLARFDAALDRLDAMFLSATTIVTAVDDFYRTLSDEQKAKLDTLSL